MAVWPFNRKKQDQALPDEVQEYYESGRKQRSGMAWLLALGTLVLTVLLAIALFFGGRWVIQQFSNDDEADVPETTQTEDQDLADQGQTRNPTEGQGSDGSDNQQGSSSTSTTQPSSASSPTPAATPAPAPASTPQTGPGPEGLQ